MSLSSNVKSFTRTTQLVVKPADSISEMGKSPTQPDCSALVIMARTLCPELILNTSFDGTSAGLRLVASDL